MSLRTVQIFLTRYIRDQDFRYRYRNGAANEIESETGLSADERSIIRDIELDHLDRIAEHIITERFGRTNAVFGAFLEHLSRFAELPEFYRGYDREWKNGWWQRLAEVRRYALDYIVAHDLPEYLVDLCLLCSHVTTIADSPKVMPPTHADPTDLDRVRGNFRVTLRRPFDVVQLRHDALSLIDNPDDGTPLPIAMDFLIQRDWRQHKRSRVFKLRENPVLRALADRPGTVFELAGRLPEISYATLLTAIAELYADSIVHLEVPDILAGDIVTASQGKGEKVR